MFRVEDLADISGDDSGKQIFENYLCNEPQLDLIPALALSCTIYLVYYLLYKCFLKRKNIPMTRTISCMMCISELIFLSKALFWIANFVAF